MNSYLYLFRSCNILFFLLLLLLSYGLIFKAHHCCSAAKLLFYIHGCIDHCVDYLVSLCERMVTDFDQSHLQPPNRLGKLSKNMFFARHVAKPKFLKFITGSKGIFFPIIYFSIVNY